MNNPVWLLTQGMGPLVAAAIHHGHEIREEIRPLLAVSESDRLREEDPFTGSWTEIAPTRVVVTRSRFEVDLNRPREKAVYLKPEEAWGLQVWKKKPTPKVIAGSLAQYDAFYAEMRRVFSNLKRQFGCFVVFDLHTYNHLREGPNGPPANLELNPEVNVGTGTLNRDRFGPIVDRFMQDVRRFDYLGSILDIRENVNFEGGYFSEWAHREFGDSACVLAIEVKKFFMDEWTGIPDPVQLCAVQGALASTVPGVLGELKKLCRV